MAKMRTRLRKAKETRTFIKGTDFDVDRSFNYVQVPEEWVEERVILEPEPIMFSTVIVRTENVPFSDVFDVRTFVRTPEGWRDNSYNNATRRFTWEQLNDTYDSVEIIE